MLFAQLTTDISFNPIYMTSETALLLDESGKSTKDLQDEKMSIILPADSDDKVFCGVLNDAL